MRNGIALLVVMGWLILTGGMSHVAAADAAGREHKAINWGPVNDEYHCSLGLGTDTKVVVAGRPLVVWLYLQLPAKAPLPTLVRSQRNFNMIGGGTERTVSFLPLAWQEAGTRRVQGEEYRIMRTPFAVIQYLNIGSFTALEVQAFEMTAAHLLLATGDLTLEVAAPPAGAPATVPLDQDLQRDVLRERIASTIIPDVRYTGIPLRQLSAQLPLLFQGADPDHVGISILWVPALSEADTKRSFPLDYRDVPAQTVLEELARQTKRTLTIDTAAVILHQAPLPLATLEVPTKLAPTEYAVVMRRVQSLVLPEVKTDAPLAAICRQLTNDSTRFDVRHAGFRLELAGAAGTDAVDTSPKVSIQLGQVSFYDAARYLALTTGCQLEVQQDRLLLIPPAAPAPAPAK